MSILEMLAEYDGERGRVVSFKLSADCRHVRVEECCDMYFHTDLTRAEFRNMLSELEAIYLQMAD